MTSKKRERITINASGQAVGRLATQIATILMGKHKADYQPHIDNGDAVVVLNPRAVKLTGDKINQKVYYRHSTHPGGLKMIPVKKLLKDNPQKVILAALAKMLPKNKLRVERLKRVAFKD